MKQLLSVLLLAVLFTGFINAQSKMAFGLQAGIAIPTGDFGDGLIWDSVDRVTLLTT